MQENYEKAVNLLKENQAVILKLEVVYSKNNMKRISLLLDLSKIPMNKRKDISTKFLEILDFDKEKLKEFCELYPNFVMEYKSNDYVKKIPLLMSEKVDL